VRKAKAKTAVTKAIGKPVSTSAPDPVMARRAHAYRDMEPHVCDLARAATLAMVVFDQDDLFLFAVEQFDAMAQRFRANYYAEQFKPE
jgi:hypothetical protein